MKVGSLSLPFRFITQKVSVLPAFVDIYLTNIVQITSFVQMLILGLTLSSFGVITLSSYGMRA